MPSFVVALTLTGAESASARMPLHLGPVRRRASAPRRSASRRRSRPRRRAGPSTTRSRSSESASRHCSSSGGKSVAEVAEAAGAEQRVDHRVGEHVGVGVAPEPALVLDLDPAEHQPPPGGEPVAVVADADALIGVDPRPSGSSRRSRPSKTQISSTPQPRIVSIASIVVVPDVARARGRPRRARRPHRVDAHLGEGRRRVDLAARACAARRSRPRPRRRSRRSPRPRLVVEARIALRRGRSRPQIFTRSGWARMS